MSIKDSLNYIDAYVTSLVTNSINKVTIFYSYFYPYLHRLYSLSELLQYFFVFTYQIHRLTFLL